MKLKLETNSKGIIRHSLLKPILSCQQDQQRRAFEISLFLESLPTTTNENLL